MIDFNDRSTFASARTFLSHFKGRPHELPASDFHFIADFLLQRARAEEELLIELCGWEDRELEAFLSACWRSAVYDAQNLASLVLARRGLAGLVHWIEGLAREEGGARWLVDVLAEVYDDDSTRLLIRLLDHPDSSIRRRASDGLASHRTTLDPRAFVKYLTSPLVQGLAYPDPLAAVRALHRIADPALEPGFGGDAARRAERALIHCVQQDARADVRGDAIAALGEIGSRAAVHCLVDMLSSEERGFHRDIVIALRKIQPERAVLALLSLLRSQDPMIREEAANALGNIGDRQAIRRLHDLLEDPHADVRQEAVLALGKLGGAEVLEALERAMADADPLVRAAACAALAEGLGPRAQGRLIEALYDGAADVRGEAAFHLGNIGDEHARTHLEARLADREVDAFGETVASIARKSLNRIELSMKVRPPQEPRRRPRGPRAAARSA